MVVLPWDAPILPANQEEEVLLSPLIAFIRKTNRINERSIVKLEMPWNGRRVDVATLTSNLTTTAYELKLSSIQRAIEQASYSRLSFDRSWVVTLGRTGAPALAEAQSLGIGVMSLIDGTVRILAPARRQPRTSVAIRARLIRQLRDSAATYV